METFTETKPRRDGNKKDSKPQYRPKNEHRGGHKNQQQQQQPAASEDVEMAESTQETRNVNQKKQSKYQPKGSA